MSFNDAEQIILLTNRFAPESTVFMSNGLRNSQLGHDDAYEVVFGTAGEVAIRDFIFATFYYRSLVGYDG
ncbi:MAG: hypothetical protein ACRC9Z_10320 [Weissella confusa]